MNPEKMEKRRRAMLSRINQMRREGVGQMAEVVKGKTPRGQRAKLSGNLWMPYGYSQLLFRGVCQGVCDIIRAGQLINSISFGGLNNIVNEGINDNLDVYFDAGTQKLNWYMGLINQLNFVALDDTDIYDDINQAGNDWDSFTSYTDANNGGSSTTRPEWQTIQPSGKSVTNTVQSIFDITASGAVKGIFIVAGPQAQTKGDHTAGNILWATALFTGGDVPVVNGDQLKITYTVNASHP